jgi:hypothetical protein
LKKRKRRKKERNRGRREMSTPFLQFLDPPLIRNELKLKFIEKTTNTAHE